MHPLVSRFVHHSSCVNLELCIELSTVYCLGKMASNVTQLPDSRVSSSEVNKSGEKISPVPSYEGEHKHGGSDVKYGSSGVEEKDLGFEQSQASEVDEEGEPRSWFNQIWRRYKPFFHAFFVIIMTG